MVALGAAINRRMGEELDVLLAAIDSFGNRGSTSPRQQIVCA